MLREAGDVICVKLEIDYLLGGMRPPEIIEGFRVIEYGSFTKPLLPKGYLPPPDGRPPLEPMQNLAICRATGVDGFYLLYCTPEWRRVTASYHDTIEGTKRDPAIEFGHDVVRWSAA